MYVAGEPPVGVDDVWFGLSVVEPVFVCFPRGEFAASREQLVIIDSQKQRLLGAGGDSSAD